MKKKWGKWRCSYNGMEMFPFSLHYLQLEDGMISRVQGSSNSLYFVNSSSNKDVVDILLIKKLPFSSFFVAGKNRH